MSIFKKPSPDLVQDEALLGAIDNHPQDCDSTEGRMLESMMRQVRGGKVLTTRQREWAEELLERLDERE